MTDAEIIRACAARFTVWHAPAHVIVNDLLRIADRLEKIDVQEAKFRKFDALRADCDEG